MENNKRVPPDELPPDPQHEHRFVARGWYVFRGTQRVAVAVSGSMAERIANALNRHTPNKRGR